MIRKQIPSIVFACCCWSAQAQVSLDSSEFPLIGTSYLMNNVAFFGVPPVSAAGPAQTYDFTTGFTYGWLPIDYYDANTDPFSAQYPSATLGRYIQGDDFDRYFYYDTDANGFWQKGMVWVGYILDTSTIDTLFFYYNAPNEDTLLSNLYTYGYSDSTYALSEVTIMYGLTPVDFYSHLYKKIDADGWGTIEIGSGSYDSTLRVHVTEYKYDSTFVFGSFDLAELDTIEYYLYYKEGIRHPLVKELVEPYIEINGPDTNYYYLTEILNLPPEPVIVLGCTDSTAVNFNPLATQDDGSCVTCAPISYTLTSDTFMCEGDMVTLDVTGGSSYLWSTGDTTSTITVNPSTTTTYSVLINSSQYCWEQATVEITVYNDVVADFWNGAPNNSVSTTFVNMSTGATDYSWDFGDGSTSTDASPSHFYDSLGSYTVTLAASNICSVDTMITTINVMISTPEFTKESTGLKVVPNPVLGSARVVFTIDNTLELNLDVIDVLGRETSVFNGLRLDGGSHAVDISDHVRMQPPGVYFIRLKSTDGQAYFKWIKQ